MTAQTNKVEAGFVWINEAGKWITYRESTTHTGTHRHFGTTDNLSDAYVAQHFPRHTANIVDVGKLIALPVLVEVVRVVKLTQPLAAPGAAWQ